MKDTGLVIDSGDRVDDGDAKPSRRYDRFRDRVMFPILDARGNVIGFGGRVIGKGEPKYLNSPETPLFEKGRELYGLYQARRAIRDANQVIVVEGYMDVVALAQHGVENAVATLGTATTPFHVSKLLKLADNVVFCFDGDEAGQKAAWRALEVAIPVLADGKTVSFLFLPAEDDPDTFVRKKGREAFAKALADAKPLSQFLFAELASRVDMKSEEGRARFLAQAKPLVAEIQAPALGAMLRRRLAELAGLSLDEIDRLVPGRTQERQPRPAPAGRTTKRNVPLESKLLARILLKPELAGSIPEDALKGAGQEAATLRTVVAYLRENPSTLGQASAYFAGSEHEGVIEEALAEPLLHQTDESELDIDSEVEDLAGKLRRQQLDRRRMELMRLIDAGSASPAQEAEYAELHEQLASSKTGNPTVESRSKH
jgi:DNA primase